MGISWIRFPHNFCSWKVIRKEHVFHPSLGKFSLFFGFCLSEPHAYILHFVGRENVLLLLKVKAWSVPKRRVPPGSPHCSLSEVSVWRESLPAVPSEPTCSLSNLRQGKIASCFFAKTVSKRSTSADNLQSPDKCPLGKRSLRSCSGSHLL